MTEQTIALIVTTIMTIWQEIRHWRTKKQAKRTASDLDRIRSQAGTKAPWE